MSSVMLKEFNEYLKKECHCSPEYKFLLTVSGGIDSVVMAYLFHRSGIGFSIAHCNFHLRGNESDEDQLFVQNLSKKMKVDFHVQHFKTEEYAKLKGLSIQMAARNLRYKWFEKIRRKNHFNYIAIGHNRDDVIETLLINLARGTGIKGLTGIKPRQGYIVRPLLFASRRDIETYAADHHIGWRDDSSNAETKYHRNKIRHLLIPEFEKAFPAFRQNIINTVFHLGQAEQLFELTIENIKKTICSNLHDKQLIDIKKLLDYPSVETILFELLRETGCNQSMIHSLLRSLSGESGKKIITKTHTITRDRDYLMITKNIQQDDQVIVVDHNTTLINDPIQLKFSQMTIESGSFTIPTEKNIAALDLDLITFPLHIRRWRPGDCFKPLGLNGRKKVSDYLIDHKIALPDKQHIRVLESDGNIIWLIGHRIDDRFKISANTKNILIIETTHTT